MPNSNGKGPAGAGPKTGKGLGPCADDAPGSPATGKGHGNGHGNGKGNGHGNGKGSVTKP